MGEKQEPVKTVKIYNTLNRQLEKLETIKEGEVGFYACGPTVYNYAHIGNLRTYISEDFIRRALVAAGYKMRHVMNITDVGHLQHDEEESGEDKMCLASKREKKSPWEIARYYEDTFFDDCAKLNVIRPEVTCRATDFIDHMIDFVKKIEEKGYTYEVDGNVYFSIDKWPEYGKLARLNLDADDVARVATDSKKKNPRDFVLWFSQSKFPNQIMKWDSPWGNGFPGWHVECSVMATHFLGEQFDLHMGGIDHIPIHHTNEIAQSEACLGHQWVNYWAHCEFLIIDNAKMSKSDGNFLRMQTLEDKGFHPLHYRYFCATAGYRTQLKFSWEALAAARDGFEALKNRVVGWKHQAKKRKANAPENPKAAEYQEQFWSAAFNDFNVAQALGVLWTMAKDSALPAEDKLDLILDFDRLLGFGAADFSRPDLPEELIAVIRKREEARASKNWATSDQLRDELLEQGIQLKDTPAGTDWYRVVKD